jgi:ABC-2 type transport system permease protein
MSALAARMVGADFLKLRKRRGTLAWALVLALGPVIVFFVVSAVQHASDPATYGPAGGTHAFTDGLRMLAIFFGPLAAILIGDEASSGDFAAGVFRDLVVTGRSRLALFASRLPAALALCWTIVTVGYALLMAGVFALASGLPTPGAGEALDGYGFMLLGTGVLCASGLGFSSLTTSKPASITALIGWQLVASPLIAQIDSLGEARKALLSQAVLHFSPVEAGRHADVIGMSTLLAVLVLLAWNAALLALGAWRTHRVDA